VKNGKEAAFKLNNCTLLKSLFSPRSFFKSHGLRTMQTIENSAIIANSYS